MKKMKKFMALLIVAIMMTSNIATAFATDGVGGLPESVSGDDKCPIVEGANIPASPVKPGEGETVESLTKNPDQPNIYTLRTDYLVERGVDDKGEPKYVVNYQPYIASVGEKATDDEKAKVNKTINLPDIPGYNIPTPNSYRITYDIVKNAANNKKNTGNEEDGFRYEEKQEFKYPGNKVEFKVKHVFQDLEDFTKYTNLDGTVGDDTALFTTQNGNTGSTMEVSPLNEGDPRRKGFVPEAESIKMLVPEDSKDFILEYRYNRAHFDVVFDTQGGTPLPARTLYYGQEIPKIADVDIPTKVGGEFQGWKPSVDLKTKDGKEYKANEIIAVGTDVAIKDLDANLIMPAEKLTFTAVWKDKEKADYAVQFWAEKADHADNAGLEKYDYIGTRVYKNQATGSRPDLDNEPVKDIVFPDLDQARLQKIWAGTKFYADKYLYLNKFYVYNKDLTHDQNKDPKNVNLVKSVDSTGRTVYNIYYDRQVYDLYFTKSNALGKGETFYPEIWGYDEDGDPVQLSSPGKPYHYKARFNQLMLGWPNDAMQTKGFTPGWQSIGWGPNYGEPHWPVHLDTPPYRLNADQFLDMEHYNDWGGYVSQIDNGAGGYITADSYKTLSFGIKQAEDSMPHHMDFWMDGFKPDETIIRYDLYRFKADTKSDDYKPKYPQVQGFTAKGEYKQVVKLDADGIDAKNEKRAEVTPFPSKEYTIFGSSHPIGEMAFVSAFFNNADEFGEPIKGTAFDTNGYLKFDYYRNKYPLRFNYDPSITRDDSYFNGTNSLNTFYEFPLKALSPDLEGNEEYKKENPANLLDDPENLQTLGLIDLVEKDDEGKLRVKRPDNLSDQMVFKGWALDPAGKKMVWKNPGEKMPNHPLNLYAIWDEPDYKWKVTFDPDGGKLDKISEEAVTQKRKTIKEGDIDDEKEITYAKKEKNEGDKQIFTVVQRQKLVEPQKPKKKGYDFLGWEVIRYKKDDDGNYTNEQDNSYREKYKVPELYSFGTDVVAPIYLKAIWVPNQMVDVEVEHYFLDKEYKLDTSKNENPAKKILDNQRANYMALTTGDKQDVDYILATPKELENHNDSNIYAIYKEYNDRVGLNNSYFQTFRVGPEKIPDPNDPNKMIDNPNNVFKFFYRPFRRREYKVNYLDERAKEKLKAASSEAEKKAIIKEYSIIEQEEVINGNRDYDARNYKKIPGWVLAEGEKPQQQLVFDVNEETNEFLGINKTGKKEITFYYKDVRLIEVPENSKTPEGYVRVTFRAKDNGKLEEGGKEKTVHYDVVKGLPFGKIPVPELMDYESTKEGVEIVPNEDYQFVGWEREKDQSKGLLGKDKGVCENYTYVAKFEKPEGKLTIKKVLENKPVEKQSTMARMAAPDPLKFKFKVTGPKINGSKNNEPTEYTEEFELAAGETKVLENLFDGDYKVEEIENHGYTPYYIEGDYDKTSSKLSKDPIKVKLEKTDNKKDYEKTLTVVNKNVKPGEAETPNKNIIDITVKKIWDGGTKPATTIELWRKGQALDGKAINEKVGDFTTTPEGDNEQSHIFKDLPKHDPSSREFEYYVKEEKVPENYTNKITGSIDKGFTVTNTYQKIDAEANKVWKGDLKEGETRPTIYFKLYRKIKDGKEIEVKGQEVKKLENGITKVTWKDLDRFDENGNEFTYSVKEVKENGSDFTPEGYTKKEEGLTVTNTKDTVVPPTPDPSVPIDITVKKIWDGGKKPATTIELWRKGQALDGKAINEKVGDFTTTPEGDNEQSKTFKDLPKHDPSSREFEYYVKEENVPKDYTNKITGSMDKGFTVTNTYQKIDVEANKVWKGDLKEGETKPTIYFKLYRKIKDGEETEVQGQEVKKLENGTTKATWKDLDRFDETGNEFIYSVKEVKENGSDFTPEGYTKKEEGLTVTNTKDTVVPPTPDPSVPIDITVKKIWDGGTKPATTIELWRKGQALDGKAINEKVGDFTTTPEGDNEQSHIFKDLPKHDPSGREFEYYVKEENVPKDYTNKITGSMDKGFTVTNTYQKIDVEANKVWKGDLKEGETKPTIYFKLYRKIKDGEETEVQGQEVKKLENGTTKATWKDLDRFDETGNEFTYSVKEVKENGSDFTPEGYTKKEEGLTVTNTKDTVVPPTPDKPENPKPKKTSNRHKDSIKCENSPLPTTGIITNYEIYIGLIAASSVGLFFTRKKNKDED